jgi:hypothetical protein
LLNEMCPTSLRNRLVLLHHFSDSFCPGIAMFPLGFLVRCFPYYRFCHLSFRFRCFGCGCRFGCCCCCPLCRGFLLRCLGCHYCCCSFRCGCCCCFRCGCCCCFRCGCCCCFRCCCSFLSWISVKVFGLSLLSWLWFSLFLLLLQLL